jgi:hypothetical protein
MGNSVREWRVSGCQLGSRRPKRRRQGCRYASREADIRSVGSIGFALAPRYRRQSINAGAPFQIGGVTVRLSVWIC